MLKSDPHAWFSELEAAKEYRDLFLDDWEEQLSKYHGPEYKSDQAPTYEEGQDPENAIFEWISLMIPQITASNPRVRVKSARAGIAQDGSKAIQFALNRWARLVRLNRTNELLATDYALKWCIAAVFPVPQAGMESPGEPSLWPVVRRISPRRYLQDPAAVDASQLRWQAHLVVRDKEDVLEQAKKGEGWDLEALEALPENTEQNEVEENIAPTQQKLESLDRHQVSYWEIYVPELQPDKKRGPDKGYNGAILTLGVGQNNEEPHAAWIRKPRPYFGRRGGMYHVCGAYVVPDDAMPLSPTVATQPQADHLNAVARAVQRAVEDYKRIALVSSGDPDLESVVSQGKHGSVYTANVEDIQRNVVQLELGGLTSQFLAAEDRARQSLDRNSGIPEAMRGNVEGGATATEIQAATGGASVRFSHHIEKFRMFQSEILQDVAWHLEYNDSIRPFSLGPEAIGQLMDPETGMPVEAPWIRPGLDKDSGQTFSDFDDYDFEIEVYSMRRTSEEQSMALASELDEVVLSVGQAMTNPATAFHIDYEAYLEKRAELRGVPDYTRFFDFALGRQVAAMMLQTQAPQPPQKGGTPQPRLIQDLAGARPGTGGGLNQDRKSMQPAKMLNGQKTKSSAVEV